MACIFRGIAHEKRGFRSLSLRGIKETRAPIKRCILLGATNIKLVKSRNKISKDKVDSNDGKDNRSSKDDDITDD